MKYYLFLSVACLAACSQSPEEKAFEFIQSYVLDRDIDALSVQLEADSGACVLNQNMLDRFKSAAIIEFNMVGFPYKTPNTDQKTLVSHLDAAEFFSLRYLNTFCEHIQTITGKEVILTIFTDGIVFCDVEGISDETVLSYEKQLKAITQDLKHIKIQTMCDLLPGFTPTQIRTHIESFSPNLSEFSAKIQKDPSYAQELEILTKRLSFEFNYPQGQEHLKIHSLDSISKKVLHRSLEYSSFLKAHRAPQSIRLSVHYQKTCDQKMGIKLSPQSNITPWHGALVIEDANHWHIQHLCDIDQIQYEKSHMTVHGHSLPFFQKRR